MAFAMCFWSKMRQSLCQGRLIFGQTVGSSTGTDCTKQKGIGSCRSILIYIQQAATLRSLFYLETAPLHVSGGTSTHHQERKELYL